LDKDRSLNEISNPDDERMPLGLVAREYSGEGYMDDFEAFVETVNPSDHRNIIEEMNQISKWRAAKSLLMLRRQIDLLSPNRDRNCDGIIGGLERCPGSSDHCPNIIENKTGIVTAIDITHDPDRGCDLSKICRSISSVRDRRIKYIIFKTQICRSYPIKNIPAWTWQKFIGRNPHLKHAHFSVIGEKNKYDDKSTWMVFN